MVRGTAGRYQRADGGDVAAALTYWAVLAVAPGLLALVAVLGLVADGPGVVADVLESVARRAPGLDLAVVEGLVRDVTSGRGAGWVLAVSVLAALWSASGYVNAFGRAMNRVHGLVERRPLWRVRARMLVVTLVVLVLAAVVCGALVLAGPVVTLLGDLLGVSELAVGVWSVARWPVVLGLMAVVVAVLYGATPDRDRPQRGVTVGAVVAIGLWLGATAGFGVYVAGFATYDRTYGALAGVVVLLLWVWLTNVALVLGAALDAERSGQPRPVEVSTRARSSSAPGTTE